MTTQRESERKTSRSDGDGRSNGTRRSSARLSPVAVARRVSDDLAELVGRDPEGVISIERNDDGWVVGVEILELHRVPDTADVLAEYEVSADDRGRLTGYRRVARYTRGRAREG